MHSRRWRGWGAGLLLGVLAACGGGGSGEGFWVAAPSPSAPEPPPAPVTATVQGRVIDAQTGRVLEGVQVQAGGRSLRTSAEGAFAFTLDAASTPVTVVASKSGFRTQARPLPLLPGARTTQDLRVYPLQHEERFPAERGVMAWVGPGVVDIPRGAVIDGAGQPYAGEVLLRASFGNPTSAPGNDSQPQPYEGRDGNARTELQTLGTIEFELLDGAGGPLGLGVRAGLSYPGLSAIDRGASLLPGWRHADGIWSRVEGARRLADGSWERTEGAERLSDGSYLLNVEQPGVFQLAVPVGNAPASASVRACVRVAQAEAARGGIALVITGPGYQRTLFLPGAPAPAWQIDGLPTDQALQATFVDAGSSRLTTLDIPALRPGALHTLPCVSLVGTAPAMPVSVDVVSLPELVPDPVQPLQAFGLLRVSGRGPGGPVSGLLCMGTREDGRIEVKGRVRVGNEARSVLLSGRSQTGRYYRLVDEDTASGPLVFMGRTRTDWWWSPYDGDWEWFTGATTRAADTTGSFWSDDQIFPGEDSPC